MICFLSLSVAIHVTKSIDTLQDSKINSKNHANSVSKSSAANNSKAFRRIVQQVCFSDEEDESIIGAVQEEKLHENFNDDIIPSSPPHKKVI